MSPFAQSYAVAMETFQHGLNLERIALKPCLSVIPEDPILEKEGPAPAAAASNPESPIGVVDGNINSPTTTSTFENFAYVTLLTRDSYLEGVQCLQRSLTAAQSLHPLIVLYTIDSLSAGSIATLEAEGCIMKAIERYLPQTETDHSQYKMACYAECWCKLRMWQLEDYDRLIYLDADMLVCRNLDHLFLLPDGFWAAPDCAAGRPTQKERDECALLRACCGQQPHYFNAGMFVMTPNAAQFQLFSDILSSGECSDCWQYLSPSYNLQKAIRHHHPSLWSPEDAHVLHFTDKKPWGDGLNHPENALHADICKMWWRVFNGGTL